MIRNKIEKFSGSVPTKYLEAITEFFKSVEFAEKLFINPPPVAGCFINKGRLVLSDGKNIIQIKSDDIKASEAVQVYFPQRVLEAAKSRTIETFIENGVEELYLYPRQSTALINDKFISIFGHETEQDTEMNVCFNTTFTPIGNQRSYRDFQIGKADLLPIIDSMIENVKSYTATDKALACPSFFADVIDCYVKLTGKYNLKLEQLTNGKDFVYRFSDGDWFTAISATGEAE
jgi:hypothetical protein